MKYAVGVIQLTVLLTLLMIVRFIRWTSDQKSFMAFLAVNVAVVTLALAVVFGLVVGATWSWLVAAVVVGIGFAFAIMMMLGAGQLTRAASMSSKWK